VTTVRGPFIQTYSGKHFYWDDPDFHLEDIAHALGMNCRFNGHTRHFYSVAEHSLLVSLLMEELRSGDPLEGLVHDAHEAYLTDVPRPFKQQLPDWQVYEDRLEKEVRLWAGLPVEKSKGLKEADQIALFIEGWYLVADRGECFSDPLGVRPKALRMAENEGWRVINLDPKDATAAFTRRFLSLTEGRNAQRRH